MPETRIVDGLRVRTWPAHRPGAPVVLALHDLTANADHWALVADALDGEVALVAFDLRGRCGSLLVEPGRTIDHAADARSVAATIGGPLGAVIGHGFGAGVAAAFVASMADPMPILVVLDGPVAVDPASADPMSALDPSAARLEQTLPHRDAYLAWWRSRPWLGDAGYDRATRAALTADLGGSGFGWRARVDPAAVMSDVATADHRAWDDVDATAVVSIRATAGHRPGDPPLDLEPIGASEAHPVDGTHAALLLRREPANRVAEILREQLGC